MMSIDASNGRHLLDEIEKNQLRKQPCRHRQQTLGFCHTLRHDGIDYGDYIEQLTYLLFLKMADERSVEIPKGCDWNSLKDMSGTALTDHYQDILRRLREAKGLLGDIFSQSMPRFNNPVNLKRLITLIDEEEWTAMDVDVRARPSRPLEKAASEGRRVRASTSRRGC